MAADSRYGYGYGSSLSGLNRLTLIMKLRHELRHRFKVMKLRNEALEGWVRPKTPPPSPVRWLRSGRRRPEEDRPEEDG